jgi:hypothetical protein
MRGKEDSVQRTIAVFVAVVAMVATVHAQRRHDVPELADHLTIGETVFVTNRVGKTVKGSTPSV